VIKWDDWYYYDETSPSCLRWAVNRYKGRGHAILLIAKDAVAGSFDTSRGSGYYVVFLHKKGYTAHRVIWEMHNGPIPDDLMIDHINGDSSDNRLPNLRLVTKRVNARNQKKRSCNTSGVTGVSKTTKDGNDYWIAFWTDDKGKGQRKSFNCCIGERAAFTLACEYRARMIATHEGYTERHGL